MTPQTINITTDVEDLIVTVVKEVRVPRGAIMDSSDPARALIDVVQGNLRTALDKDGYHEAKEILPTAMHNAHDDITNRINEERGTLTREESKKLRSQT